MKAQNSMKRSVQLTLLCSILFGSGCALNSNSDDYWQKTAERYEGKDVSAFPLTDLSNFNFAFLRPNKHGASTKKTRKTASHQKDHQHKGIKSLKKLEEEKVGKMSAKELYFSLLYYQYVYFDRFVVNGIIPKNRKSITFCPKYHSRFLELQEQSLHIKQRVLHSLAMNIIKTPEMLKDDSAVSLYPELYLSMDDGDPQDNVRKYMQEYPREDLQLALYTAVELKARSTYDELNHLCEYGHSNNYYIFKNIIEYQGRKETNWQNPPGKQFKYLSKVPVFSNMIILRSLLIKDSKSISFKHPQESFYLEEELIKRIKAMWMKQYFHSLSKRKREPGIQFVL